MIQMFDLSGGGITVFGTYSQWSDLSTFALISAQTSRNRFVAIPAGAAVASGCTDPERRKSDPQRERQFDADFTRLRRQFTFL